MTSALNGISARIATNTRIVDGTVQRLAVLGSPIAHSKSPALHLAAYRVLGLEWEYSALDVSSVELGGFLAGLDGEWRGLSLTMPLKSEVIRHLDSREDLVDTVGAANTVIIDGGLLRGFNTDVYGAQRMLAEAIPGTINRAVILGSGATARSVLAALALGGTREVFVWSRSTKRSTEILSVAQRVGVSLNFVTTLDTVGHPDVVISTLPGVAELPRGFASSVSSQVPLVDIAYDPWPTGAARLWLDNDGPVVNNGLGMLIYQALIQIRIFVHGDPTIVLAHEDEVLAAMRGAAFRDA